MLFVDETLDDNFIRVVIFWHHLTLIYIIILFIYNILLTKYSVKWKKYIYIYIYIYIYKFIFDTISY